MIHKEKVSESNSKEIPKDFSTMWFLPIIRQLAQPRFRHNLIEWYLNNSDKGVVKMGRLFPLKAYALGSLEALRDLHAAGREKLTGRSKLQSFMDRIGYLLSQKRPEEKTQDKQVKQRPDEKNEDEHTKKIKVARAVAAEHIAPKVVARYIPILDKVISEEIAGWKENEQQGELFDLRKMIDALYVRIVSKILFAGKEPPEFARLTTLVSSYLTDMAGYTTALIMDDKFPPYLKKVKEVLQHIFVDDMEGYPEFLRKEKELVDGLESFLNNIPKDQLDQYGMFGAYLRKVQEGELSLQEIRRELIGMLFAALDTTSRATMFLMGYLQSDRELFLKLKAEVMRKFGYKKNTGEALTLEDISDENIPLLVATIYASMGAKPPVKIWIREAKENLTLDGEKVSKGSMIFINIGSALSELHLDKDGQLAIETLLTTQPDGSLKLKDERGGIIHDIRMAWAFGGDQHPCMGELLSMGELKLLLVRFLLEAEEIRSNGVMEADHAATEIPQWLDEKGNKTLGPQPKFSMD